MRRHFIIGLMLLFILSNTVRGADIEIPYDGMTLKWNYELHYTNDKYPSWNYDKESEFLYSYRKIDNYTYIQTDLKDNSEDKINISTRTFIEGDEEGKTTSHWIPKNLTLGDKVLLLDNNYTVVSLSEKVFVDGFGWIEAIELKFENYTIPEDLEKNKDKIYEYKYSDSIYYDKVTLIKLKEIGETSYLYDDPYFGEMKIESKWYLEIVENGLDTD
ncbi:MAG: hypothetical protein DRN24_01175, partial [Thermoplasmata archaeon]